MKKLFTLMLVTGLGVFAIGCGGAEAPKKADTKPSTPSTDGHMEEGHADAPKEEGAPTDAPKEEGAPTDAPKEDAPADAPKEDAPKADAPKEDAPKADAPADAPKKDE